MPISSALGSSALLPAGLGFRNKIQNGDMRIAQRGTTGIAGSGSAQYPVDRWVVYNNVATVTFQQSTVAPPGFTYSLGATQSGTSAYGTSGYTELGQMIEGFNCQDLAYGTSSAKPITISFWVRSSVIGTYNIAFQNNAQNRTYVASYSIVVANTWEYKTIQIPGDTSGTWLTDNSVGLRVWFNLGMGGQYDTAGNAWTAGNLGSTSNAVNFAENSGATFYITGVQLEQNYQPTPFEQRPIGTELALCQRYYFRITNNNTNTFIMGTGNAAISTNVSVLIPHPVTMRVKPTLIETNGAYPTDLVNYYGTIGSWVIDTAVSSSANCFVTNSTTSGLTPNRPHSISLQGTNGYFALGCEL